MIESLDEQAERRLDALIALISDIDACKARRAELKAEQTKATNLAADAVAAHGAADEKRTAADQVMAQAADARDHAAATLQAAKTQAERNDARTAELDERQAALEQREEAVKAWSVKTGEQEAAVKALLLAVEARGRQADDAFAQAQALMADYDKAKHDAALKLAQ